MFVAETPSALALVDAVREGDLDTIRDVLTGKDDAQLWTLALVLAALVTDDPPDPERVLDLCCDTQTRLTYSARPQAWPVEDLQTALCVAQARTAPGATWVARGVAEHRRRRAIRDAQLDQANARALAARRDNAHGKVA